MITFLVFASYCLLLFFLSMHWLHLVASFGSMVCGLPIYSCSACVIVNLARLVILCLKQVPQMEQPSIESSFWILCLWWILPFVLKEPSCLVPLGMPYLRMSWILPFVYELKYYAVTWWFYVFNRVSRYLMWNIELHSGERMNMLLCY